MLPRRGSTAAVAVAAVLLTGCTDDGPDIGTSAVGRSTVAEVVEAPATVQAAATTTLTSPAAGEVARVYVRDGQRVAAGTLIATVDSPSARSQLAQARSALAQAESAGPTAPTYLSGGTQTRADSTAHDAFGTARQAAGQIPDPRLRAAALTQVEAAEKQYALAAAQARSAIAAINSGIGNLNAALASLSSAQRVQARAAVQLAQQAVDALEIKAPIGGTVQLGGLPEQGGGTDLTGVLDQLPAGLQDQAASALGGGAPGGSPGVRTTGPVVSGTPVTPGTPLATIVDVSVLSLTAEVDETDVFLVKPGVRAVVELDAVPGAQYGAVVKAVDLSPTAAQSGGVSYRVRLALGRGTLPDGEPAPTPRPGMSAVADLRVRTATDAVSVPSSAVVRDGDRDAVWVLDGQVARRRPVTVGTQGEDVVEVTEGLRVGERVVTRGADQVREGQELS